VNNYTNNYTISRRSIVRGNLLKPGELSIGLYGIVATDKDLVLRVQLRAELAELYTEDKSRHIQEIFLGPEA